MPTYTTDVSKVTLFYVPIEPLAERYTQQWLSEIPKELDAAGFNVKVILGKALEDEVKVGTFLDINSTVHYKMVQLQKIAALFNKGQVPNGSIFFFGDIEFWGIESVRLMADMNGLKNIKLAGFLHAASYTKDDAFQIAHRYQRYTEVGWIAAMDMVFVGSQYHKNAVIDRRITPIATFGSMYLGQENEVTYISNKIKVTKNPLFLDQYPNIDAPREKKIVLTNRFDREKGVEDTLRIFENLHKKQPDWKFVITTGRSTFRGNDPELVAKARELEAAGVLEIKAGLTKAQYYHELATAAMMITNSYEENYGYCIAEAMIYGCLPVMTCDLSHVEFLDPKSSKYRDVFFHTYRDAIAKVTTLMERFGTPAFPDVPMPDTRGMDNIVLHLCDLAHESLVRPIE